MSEPVESVVIPGDAWKRNASVLLFTDQASLQPALAESVRARALRKLGPFGLTTNLPMPAAADVALIDLTDAVEETAEQFLQQILPELDAAGIPIIATIEPLQIDQAAFHLLPLGAEILCAPDARSCDAALARALDRPAGRLHEPNGTGSAQLREMHEDAARLLERMRALLAPEPPQSPPAPKPPISASGVRDLIRQRRLRERFFGEGLFADPAWDMLLDLYAAHLEGGQVCVSSLCYAAAVPPTTALRWIGQMTQGGLLLRDADPRDKRRHFIALTDRAIASMNSYFLTLGTSQQFH